MPTLDLDEHTGAVVPHVTDQPERHGVAVYERAEADALDGAGDSHAARRSVS